MLSQVLQNDYKVIPLQALLHHVHAKETRYTVKMYHAQSMKQGLCNLIRTCYKIHFHFYHVPLNFFDRISEGKMCLPEGRLYLLLGISKDAESLSTFFAII